MRNLKKELKIAYELANNFDCVPDDTDKVREYVDREMKVDVTDEDINNVVGHFMGENTYTINEYIRAEYFKTED